MSFDSNVDSVCAKFQERAYLGYQKYGCTTERTDIDLHGWLNHLQEELMDAVVYIERAKRELALEKLAAIDQQLGLFD